MNKQMQRIQEKFKGNENLKILSFTVDPAIDNTDELEKYAKEMKAKDGQWHFLTGQKEELYSLARKSFFILKPAEAKNLGDAGSDFIHTNNFVLVDQKKRIRGYYDGTSEEEVTKLMGHIKQLLKE
jgi:protein SCO1/2